MGRKEDRGEKEGLIPVYSPELLRHPRETDCDMYVYMCTHD